MTTSDPAALIILALCFVMALVLAAGLVSEIRTLQAKVRWLELKAGQVRDAQEHLDQVEGRLLDHDRRLYEADDRLDACLSITYHDDLMRDMAALHRRIADRMEASADAD